MEQPQAALEGLPEVLGLIPTAEMRALAARYVEAIRTGAEAAGTILAEYAERGEALVDQHSPGMRPGANIDLQVHMALMDRDAGNTDEFIGRLEEAHWYADSMGYEGTAVTIRTAMDEAGRARSAASEEAAAESDSWAIGEACQGVLDPADIQEMVSMTPEMALATAYSLLPTCGVNDPDAFLREKGIIE